MLELRNITKVYMPGENAVTALRGVSLSFRHSEFVSILGQSGCGKTTLLNLIGGLDQYTSGDLIINGKSTHAFGSRDWDTYRNHTIGFVFQSYNLIPHQSVLQNVELALTLSGVSKGERRRRAKEALAQVGLSNQLHKKPGEMSGGQMQRVAIARALVNNPDIILADEPTGALDTETSVQVMEILKEVSRDRLVIMVTHNPDLAQQYSTRIIRMLDGKVTDDSAPLSPEETEEEHRLEQEKTAREGKQKKPTMSFFTSFGLSLKNLFTKKGRTALTSFAGSIGIIGIALIYSVSQGMNTYIDTVQEETLSSYPLTLEATHVDLGTLLTTFIDAAQSGEEHDKEAVYQKKMLHDLIHSLNNLEATENDLKAFKTYLDTTLENAEEDDELRQAISGIRYAYDLDLLVYTENVDGIIIRSDTGELLRDIIAERVGSNMAEATEGNAGGGMTGMGGGMSSMFSGNAMSSGLWQELLPGEHGEPVNDLLKKQYDVVYGSWPTAYNDVVLVLDENNELDDMSLYALGLISKDDVSALLDGKEVAGNRKWEYPDIVGMNFRTILNADCFVLDEQTGLYTDLRQTDAGLKYLYDNALSLRVSGIIRPTEDALSSMLNGSIGYTGLLTKYVVEHSQQADAVKAQKENPSTDIFTDLPFAATTEERSDEEKAEAFRAAVKEQNQAKKAETYVAIMSIPPQEQLDAGVQQTVGSMSRAEMEATLMQAMASQMSVDETTLKNYLAAMTDEDVKKTFTDIVKEQMKAQYAAQVKAQMSVMTPEQLAGALDAAMKTYTTEQCAAYYDDVLTFSDATYDDNLVKLGCLDLERPSAIHLYASTFAGKDVIEDTIAAYNEERDELERIHYTDYVGLMMSSVTTIINAITYILIAFVAISLVVSSIMIGVITLISVQERTKEIGILRAIGASKRDVSSMFNAETVIIGFAAGLMGVLITYLLCIPINAIIHHLTGIGNLSAYLPLPVAAVLVGISVLLTLISGIIPSRSAAKKDPVVALRTE